MKESKVKTDYCLKAKVECESFQSQVEHPLLLEDQTNQHNNTPGCDL